MTKSELIEILSRRQPHLAAAEGAQQIHVARHAVPQVQLARMVVGHGHNEDQLQIGHLHLRA